LKDVCLVGGPGRLDGASGVIQGGMIPKVECALSAIEQSVRQIHIIDGRKRHALVRPA